jgi:hypothetical protein
MRLVQDLLNVLFGLHVEKPRFSDIQQIDRVDGLLDTLLQRQQQRQRQRDYGLPSNSRDLGADF